ncbi:MAG: hypothetical protein ACM3ZQ_04425, partial [Bacillota bacterium]
MMLLCLAAMGFLLVWLSGLAPDNPSAPQNPAQDDHCPHCQQPITAGQSFCPSCQSRLDESGRGVSA